MVFIIQYIIPYNIDDAVPYTITGPAITNICAPTPFMNPSDLASIAGEVTAFANPVIGTRVPAPAFAASLSNQPIPVNRPDKKISVTEESVKAVFSLSKR